MNETGEINIEGLDKAEVLAALYNGSQQLGMGFLNPRGSTGMSVEEARVELKRHEEAGCMYFDYLYGRVMKVNLGEGNFLRTRLYNRDNGAGAAERIIQELRQQKAAA